MLISIKLWKDFSFAGQSGRKWRNLSIHIFMAQSFCTGKLLRPRKRGVWSVWRRARGLRFGDFYWQVAQLHKHQSATTANGNMFTCTPRQKPQNTETKVCINFKQRTTKNFQLKNDPKIGKRTSRRIRKKITRTPKWPIVHKITEQISEQTQWFPATLGIFQLAIFTADFSNRPQKIMQKVNLF